MKNFKINHRETETFDVLEISGELDAHTASQLENSLKSLIDGDKHQIIVNCKHLDYIASAGLGVFMAYIEDVRSLGGDIKLTNMNENVYNVFDLLGFPTLYDILEDEEQAIEKFENDVNVSGPDLV
ncbi:MAG: STAS domain-containing protein [Balneolaceae bacterium]|nr:STAS domain-containing protein [Balneolaceae bacterium]